MTHQKTATFLGGPWDLHRVVLDDAPSRMDVPQVVERLHDIDQFREEATAVVAIKEAIYRRADFRGMSSRDPEYTVYVFMGYGRLRYPDWKDHGGDEAPDRTSEVENVKDGETHG